jgi:hypothetical protein
MKSPLHFIHWPSAGFSVITAQTKRQFLELFSKLRKATISIVMSSRPSVWNKSVSPGRIFVKFGIKVFFENL